MKSIFKDLKLKAIILLLLLSLINKTFGQKVIVFDFNNSLTDTSGKIPPLNVIGRPGVFVDDTLQELGNKIRKVYDFDINSGITFNNHQIGNFIKGDYTIELYFKLDLYNSWKRILDFKNKKADTGPYIYFRKISFYKNETEDIPHLLPGQYIHYVISRNFSTKEVSVFLNGIRYLNFIDHPNDAVMDDDHRLNFFHDNQSMGNEASAGAIAFIKIYNHTVDPFSVKKSFDQLSQTLDLLSKRKPSKPKEETLVKGNVYDEKNGAPVSAFVKFELAADSSHVITIHNHQYTGDYTTKLPVGRYYNILVTSPGFVDYIDLLDLSSASSKKEVIKDVPLNRLQAGRTVTLNKISFLQSRYELLPSSYPELDKLADLMKEHSKMEIQLNGHTDNQGNAKLNVELSENRVKAVKEYLVSKGIDPHRIKGKGYGGHKPIASNSTEATRKLNRRVEMVILKY